MDQIAALQVGAAKHRGQLSAADPEECYHFRFLSRRRIGTFPPDHTSSPRTVPQGNPPFRRRQGWCSDRKTDQPDKMPVPDYPVSAETIGSKLCTQTRDRGHRCSSTCQGSAPFPLQEIVGRRSGNTTARRGPRTLLRVRILDGKLVSRNCRRAAYKAGRQARRTHS